MQYGLCVPHYRHLCQPDIVREAARRAEDAGFHSLWVSDHIVSTGPLLSVFGEAFLEPFTLMAYLAAISPLRIGISCAILPYRHPLLVAKEVATIDQLSGGRVIFGAAAGWAEPEFRALGLPFHRRGAITDECLQVLKLAWTEADPKHEGRFFRFDSLKVEPKPLQRPHPPIWIGGVSPKGVERAVRYGDVWHPNNLAIEELERGIAYLREASERQGRGPPPVAVRAFLRFSDGPMGQGRRTWFGSPREVREDLERHRALGVDYLLTEFSAPDGDGVIRAIETFAAQVMD